MKDKLVQLKRKCVALSVALGISLTGCVVERQTIIMIPNLI